MIIFVYETLIALLPFRYTLFREHEQTGAPIMRPLWVHYPNDPSTFTIDDEYMLGIFQMN